MGQRVADSRLMGQRVSDKCRVRGPRLRGEEQVPGGGGGQTTHTGRGEGRDGMRDGPDDPHAWGRAGMFRANWIRASALRIV